MFTWLLVVAAHQDHLNASNAEDTEEEENHGICFTKKNIPEIYDPLIYDPVM